MKIASVTITYNDFASITSFREHVNDYRHLLKWHIISDNYSERSYVSQLEDQFPDSIILKRKSNGGTTAGYNTGIEYALAAGADAVLLIAQDIKLSSESLKALIEILKFKPDVGIVGPVLLNSDGKTIASYGGEISKRSLLTIRRFANNVLDDTLPRQRYVDIVPGGMNLTRKKVFEQVGLQDERLFMYGDEKDYGLRTTKNGWKLLMTANATAVHEHPSEKSLLRPWSLFLMQRNRLWLIRKHLGFSRYLCASSKELIGIPRSSWRYISKRRFDLLKANLYGILRGIIGK